MLKVVQNNKLYDLQCSLLITGEKHHNYICKEIIQIILNLETENLDFDTLKHFQELVIYITYKCKHPNMDKLIKSLNKKMKYDYNTIQYNSIYIIKNIINILPIDNNNILLEYMKIIEKDIYLYDSNNTLINQELLKYYTIQLANDSNRLNKLDIIRYFINRLPYWINKQFLLDYIIYIEKTSTSNENIIEFNTFKSLLNLEDDIELLEIHHNTNKTDNNPNQLDNTTKQSDNTINQLDNIINQTENTPNQLDNNIKNLDTVINKCNNDLKSLENNGNPLENDGKPLDNDGKHNETEVEMFLKQFKSQIILDIKIMDYNSLPIIDNNKYQQLKQQIEYIKNLPQPEQRTTEWYQYRNNMLTASDLYDGVLGSISAMNNIIVSKCRTMEELTQKLPTGKSCAWGIRYEPIAVLIYESRNNCQVEDYGCIQHPEIKHFGASPDGIVNEYNNQMVGRMLEIKCPYSRTITGIPSKKYYTQIQGQLEVCDLEYCDFLECTFKEYQTIEEMENIDSNEWGAIITIYNISKNKHIDIIQPKINMTKDDILKWIDEQKDIIINDDNLEYIDIHYWILEVYSCILIKRDKELFNNLKSRLDSFWNLVCFYRENGTDTIKSKPKNKKSKSDIPPGLICDL